MGPDRVDLSQASMDVCHATYHARGFMQVVRYLGHVGIPSRDVLHAVHPTLQPLKGARNTRRIHAITGSDRVITVRHEVCNYLLIQLQASKYCLFVPDL